MNLSINTQRSQTILCLNSLCIIMIILMHCVYNADSFLMIVTNHLLYDSITRIAVPLFFTISSILYFRDIPNKVVDFIIGGYKTKIRKRIRGLLLPYFIALFSYILIFYLAQQIPLTRSFFKPEQIIENFTINDWLVNLFVIPFNGTLWFIRDLFLINLFSPLILYIINIKYLNVILQLLLFIYWFFNINCHIEAILFTMFGLDIVKYKAYLQRRFLCKTYRISLSFLLCFFVVVKVAYMTCFDNQTYDIVNVILLKFLILSGIPYLYYMIRRIVDKDSSWLKRVLIDYNKYSFFTYLFHMLILTIIRNIFELVPGINSFFIYIGTVIGTIFFSILMYNLLNKLMPSLLYVTVGGRMH